MPQTSEPVERIAGSYDVASQSVRQAIRGDREVSVVRLAPLENPGVLDDHVVSYGYGKVERGGRPVGLAVELRQSYKSVEDQGTLVASWSHDDIATGDHVAQQALSAEQAGRITDYADLYMRFVFTRGKG